MNSSELVEDDDDEEDEDVPVVDEGPDTFDKAEDVFAFSFEEFPRGGDVEARSAMGMDATVVGNILAVVVVDRIVLQGVAVAIVAIFGISCVPKRSFVVNLNAVILLPL